MTRARWAVAALVACLALTFVAARAPVSPAAPPAPTSYADALEVALTITWNREQSADRRFVGMDCHRAGRVWRSAVFACSVRLIDARRPHQTRLYRFTVMPWGEVINARWEEA